MRDRLREDYGWTPRQREVLDLMARGRTNTEIAGALGISLAGAKWHVSEILSKLNSDSREEAAEYWRRYNGLAPRFARVFRGALTSAGLRWAAGAAVAVGAGLALVLVAFSVGGDDDSPAAVPEETPAGGSTPDATSTLAPTSTPTELPTPTPPTPLPALDSGVWPEGTRTGIPVVDRLIEIVEAKDNVALAEFAEFSTYSCEAPILNQHQPLACPAGMEPGDPVSGLWVEDVALEFWRPGDRAELAASLSVTVQENQRLHAVRTPQEGEDSRNWLPSLRYSAIFAYQAESGDTSYRTFLLSESGLIAIVFGNPATPGRVWNDPSAPGWILPRAE